VSNHFAALVLTFRLPHYIPSVIMVTLVASKVFTHNCDTGKLSALIQCRNIVQQLERDSFQRCQTEVHIYDVKISVVTKSSIYRVYVYTTLVG
jgi:hypothetical protein